MTVSSDEAPVSRFCLRDGAWRDAGEVGELGLSQMALLTDPPEARRQAAHGSLSAEPGHSILTCHDLHEATLRSDPLALGLEDPQLSAPDLQNALGHLADLIQERGAQLA